MNTLLILDDQSVDATDAVRFHLNPARKHPENPVLLPGEPHEWDSLQVSWPGTVLYSPRDKKFRCWYSGMDAFQTPERFWHAGYAESDDGVHWMKPKLDQVHFLGRSTNQVRPEWAHLPPDSGLPFWADYLLNFVFENPLPDVPDKQRFGSVWSNGFFGEDGKRTEHKFLAWSPDGVHWERAHTIYQIHPYDRFLFHDITQLIYDPDEPDPDWRIKVYSQYFQTRAYDGRPRVRHIGILHGRSLERVESAQPPTIFGPQQGIDEEIHYATVKKIAPRQFLMLFESDRFSLNPPNGDLRLAVSDDGGRSFRRVHPNTPLIPTGPRGMWDQNLLVTTYSAMQEVGDELYIFYFGCPSLYRAWPAQYAIYPERRGCFIAPVCLGLATMPRDRFAYATGGGAITTRPLKLDAGELWLNSDGLETRVELLDEQRRPIARGATTDERRQSIYRPVRWDRPPPRGMLRARIHSTDETKLFSLKHL